MFNVCWSRTKKQLDVLQGMVDAIERRTFNINQKVDMLMALVQVEQDDLDALDVVLDEATTAIETRLEALQVALPDADLSALQADVAALRNLSAPAAAPVDTPPAASE